MTNVARHGGRPVEILLVEDSPTDRLLTVSALEQAKLLNSLHVVENGLDAMAFLRREGAFADVPRPDLILLDLNLPKMDGREVLAQVKTDRMLRFIPVIVLTTSSAAEDVMRAYGDHANSFITKPVDLAQLTRALQTIGSYWFEVVTLPSADALAQLERSQVPQASRSENRGSVQVLLLEDSETDALLLKDALSSPAGTFAVVHVCRFSDAQELLAERPFDAVLTDLGLPDSEGLDTYRRVRGAARGVPIIVLTALDDEATGVAALKEGAQDYLVKAEQDARGLARSIRYAIDRKSVQDQLLQSQRMEAMGQLAGGVAHDFNNLLTIVQANASLIDLTRDPLEIKELVGEIHAAAERGATLTRQLLTFGRHRPMTVRALDLNAIVASTSKMMRRVLGDVHVELQLGSDVPSASGDVGMIEQVLLNLAVNARDAMPGGGKLTVHTSRLALSPQSAPRRNTRAYAGEFAVVSVRDSGQGIEPAILDRIWEPFFTTKESGGGTGLGLTTVYGIVAQLRGWLEVRSVVGSGTTFDVVLPAAPQVAEVPAPPPPALALRHSARTVLVVDDERSIRALATRILGSEGYVVLDAASGEEALALWQDRGGAIDLVVTDLTMPGGMSGHELAKRLRGLAPELPLVLSSGFSLEGVPEGADAARRMVYLPKPYAAAGLLDAVARLLFG